MGTTLTRAVAFGTGDHLDEWQDLRSVETEVTDFRAGHEVVLE